MMLTNKLADFISIQYGYNRLFKAKTSYADSGLNLLNFGPGEVNPLPSGHCRKNEGVNEIGANNTMDDVGSKEDDLMMMLKELSDQLEKCIRVYLKRA